MLKQIAYRLKGWRTHIVAAATWMLGVFVLFEPATWATLFKPEHQAVIIIGIGVLIHILRQITTGPPGSKA